MTGQSMSGQSYTPTPIEAVTWIREQEFPNSKVEQETVLTVDRNVTKKVKDHEDFLVSQAQYAVEYLNDRTKASEELQDQLADLKRAAQRGEELDLRAWQRIQAQAADLLPLASSIDTKFDLLLANLADPLKSLDEIYRRYPPLNRPIWI